MPFSDQCRYGTKKSPKTAKPLGSGGERAQGALAHSTREAKSSLWAGTGGTWHPNPKWNVWYRVWYATKSPTCECEYHTTGGQCRCKRMAIVEHLLLVAAESEYDPKEIVIERQCMKCPDCPSKEHTRDGWHYSEHQNKRRYRCSKCGRRFSNNLGFWVPPHAARLHHAGPDAVRHAGCLWPTYN